MTWPPWSQSNQACRIHGIDNCQECEEMHWNPQLVAQLEAERAQLPPQVQARRQTNADTPDQVAQRRQLAKEIARIKAR